MSGGPPSSVLKGVAIMFGTASMLFALALNHRSVFRGIPGALGCVRRERVFSPVVSATARTPAAIRLHRAGKSILVPKGLLISTRCVLLAVVLLNPVAAVAAADDQPRGNGYGNGREIIPHTGAVNSGGQISPEGREFSMPGGAPLLSPNDAAVVDELYREIMRQTDPKHDALDGGYRSYRAEAVH
jgi:hypothetical protein